MPHIVELDLTPAEMFRQHPATEREPHWLLKAVYGRDLLKEQLRRSEPNLQVPVWRDAPELDAMLEQMVDRLGLREWTRPTTLRERARYLGLVLAMTRAVQKGAALPDWRAGANT
ncbi:hypothetical protein [Ramlibacter albus]|uniref:Uncharacterized protein n=1 Tax=Ramlibacter albus TaxID=2079448 RepID=A0A923MC84_9BURK|nr:hypothetical protein [Ramlibacter albus]MBC5767521.1 hypothetical protein [Ramlibacter albus]